MASLFEAYITNLGKYNEGELVGETLKFPTTTEEVQALLKRIGVDGVRYEEFFIRRCGRSGCLCIKHFWTKCPEVVTCRPNGRLFSWPGKPPEKWRLYAVFFFRD